MGSAGAAASSTTSFRRLALLALAFCLLLAVPAARADAADGSLLGCGYDPVHPFVRFLDPLPYTPAPDGGFEHGAAGWKLSGGARVVAGNEPWFIGGSSDSNSLLLPAGSSATSPPMCVGLVLPVVRFFSQGGSFLSTMKVEAVWSDASGAQRSIVLLPGVLASSSWQPTLPLLQVGGALNALTLNGLTTQMSFRFTPRAGLFGAGTWRIDDVYVDPWKGV